MHEWIPPLLGMPAHMLLYTKCHSNGYKPKGRKKIHMYVPENIHKSDNGNKKEMIIIENDKWNERKWKSINIILPMKLGYTHESM